MKIVAGLPEQEYQRRYYEANKDKVAERQRRYYEANKDKLADGSVPIARKFERRNCPLFEDCLEKAAIKDWRQVPCHLCEKLGQV